MSCLACANITNYIPHKKYEHTEIIKYSAIGLQYDYFLVPKKCEVSQGVIIYYCPFCGRKLKEK